MVMQRQPEPDLMDDGEQARAYAEADFDQPHSCFIEWFQQRFPAFTGEAVLDLGCGPADISIRFAQAYEQCQIDAIDGADAMLRHGRAMVDQRGLSARIHLHQCYLPDDQLPRLLYDTVICNSLLHHLLDPLILWQTIKQVAAPGATVFVMDLMRPASHADAEVLMNRYADSEPAILRHDFYHSLLAAYTPKEVMAQLKAVDLALDVETVSDRHLLVSGLLS